jgi:hypothetical protein
MREARETLRAVLPAGLRRDGESRSTADGVNRDWLTAG